MTAPTAVALRRWAVPVCVIGAFLVVLLLAWIDAAAAVRPLDEAIDRFAVRQRTPGWTGFFRAVTNLGNPGVAFTGGVIIGVAALIRSRVTGIALLLLVVARPLASTVVKLLVDRPRPQLAPLVQAAGTSFPSGHVLAATAFWGALPAALLSWRAAHGFVRAAVVFAVLAVVVTAISRVYLGVHWFSDVVGGALLGASLLVLLYRFAVSTMDG